MRTIFLFLFTISAFCTYADLDKSAIDSLNQKAQYHWDYSKDSVHHYATLALEHSSEIMYLQGEISARVHLCFYNYLNGRIDEAIENCEQAIALNRDASPKVAIEPAYVFLGLSRIQNQQYDLAIDQYMKLIDIATNQKNDHLLADACSNMGLAYLSSGNSSKAMEYYQISWKIHENIDHPHGKVYVLQNLGRIYYNQVKYDSALFYLRQAHELAIELKNERAECYATNLLGQIPRLDAPERESLLSRTLELAEKLDMNSEIITANTYLSELYNAQGSLDLSIHHAIRGMQAAELTADFEALKDFYGRLIRLYTLKEDFSKAELYLDRFHAVSDSLSNRKSDYLTGLIGANELLEDERNYDDAKRELIEARNKLRTNQIIIFSGVICSLLIVAILLILARANRLKTLNNRRLKQLNEQLDAAMKEKDILMGMIAHDLRSPINKIQGLLNVLKADQTISDSSQEVVNMVHEITEDSKTLTRDLLEINQIESGTSRKRSDDISIEGFINEIVFHFQAMAQAKEINLEVSFDLEAERFVTDKNMLQRIIENLLSNAIKFSPRNERVEVGISLKGNLFTCRVKDSGPGIPDSEHSILFKKFGKASPRPTGNESSTGLGLYIVNQLIAKLNGSVSLHSKEGAGAEFMVNIPITY